MTRAEEVLKAMAEAKKVKRTPLRVKDKEGVRRRQAAQFSLAKLLASTKQLLPYFNKHNKIEMNSAIYHPRTQQLVVRAQVKALTDKSRTAYPETITFFRVTSKEQADAVHKIPVQLPAGQTVYIKQLSVKDNPVNLRCNCKNFYFMWQWWDFKQKALAGPRMKPYVRKTPPPPEGRPFVNPEKLPGLCKHLHGTMQKLIQMKVLGN